MLWKVLYLIYPITMGAFLREIWITRNPVNSSYALVVWDDMIILRVVCLLSSIAFGILTIVALRTRHRSLNLLWCGTVLFGGLLLLIPAYPVEPGVLSPGPVAILLGLLAHLSLLIIHDRQMTPRIDDKG